MTAPVLFPARVRWLILAITWVALGVFYVMPVSRVMEPDLDSSIHASYAYFTAHGYQFGAEVNTTAGPYGFVMFGWDYSGDLFWLRYALIIVFGFGLAAIVLSIFCAARGSVWRWIWLAAMILDLSTGDTLFSVGVLMSGLFLLLNYERADRFVTSLLVSIFAAWLALMKGTQLAEGLGALACLVLYAWHAGRWRRLLWIAAAYFGGMLICWTLAGQNPLHLPGYFNGIRHIAEGYNEAMALETPPAALRTALLLFAVGALYFGGTAWRRRAHSGAVAGCALLAGFTFVAWKHGFVRSDGHMVIFFDFVVIAAVTLPLLLHAAGSTGERSWMRGIGGGLALLIAGLGIHGSESLYPGRFLGLTFHYPQQWTENVGYLLLPRAAKELGDAELSRLKRKYNLPATSEMIGRQPVDFFGHQMGLLFLNELNYRPPPMCCGTYHVYNEYFKRLNRDHFANPRTRPEYMLLKIQSIDYRFPSCDDSLSLLALLDLYRPVLLEDEILVLKAGAPDLAPVPLKPIVTRPIKFDEEVSVPAVAPGELLLFSVNLPRSLLGVLRGLAYKPPLLSMDFTGDGLERPKDQRVIAASLVAPSLLNPTLESTNDYVTLVADNNQKRVKSFRLHTPQPGCFRTEGMTVTFYTRRRPPSVSADELRRVYLHSVYQEQPDSVVPATSTINPYKGVRVQYLHAPTVVTYNLKGNERVVTMVIGIDENAYLNGRTDGVDFYIELEQPGQPRQLLARRYLQPLTVPGDRGTHRLSGVLPPAFQPGSKLILRTDIGPDHNNGWDWSFATSIVISRGDFQREQFPGFGVVPVAVDSPNVSPFNDGKRDLTLFNAPAGVTFRLTGRERELHLTGGLVDGSYLRGETDGVGFSVELEPADGGPSQRIFRRLLQPRTVTSDRGDQPMVVPLPPHGPDSRLHLRIDPGPGDNASWDWAYVSELSFR